MTINQVIKKLKTLSEPKLLKLNYKIGVLVKNEIINAFIDEKDPITKIKWKPLALSTVTKKNKKRSTNKILRDSGHLSDYWAITPNSNGVVVSNNMAKSPKGFAYGLSHQWGSKTKNIPQRRFLPLLSPNTLSLDIKAKIKKTILKALVEDFKN